MVAIIQIENRKVKNHSETDQSTHFIIIVIFLNFLRSAENAHILGKLYETNVHPEASNHHQCQLAKLAPIKLKWDQMTLVLHLIIGCPLIRSC